MSASGLLSELRRRDIQLRVVGSELRCSAPAGALTPELREQLRQHKQDVLQLLASAQALAVQERAIVPLQRTGKRTSVFGVPGHNGDVFCYRALAQSLGDDQPFFGLQPPGLDGHGDPLRRVEGIAAYFATQIRSFQPQGPYIIAGYCAGGSVAFELAQQLLRGGAEIRLLALFGSPYPSYFRWPAQLRLGLAHQLARIGKHGLELASQHSWSERRRYLSEKLRQRADQRNADQAAALDPVLARRAEVERATLSAVRRYNPRRFPGKLHLFLPCRQWPRSDVAALRWRSLSERVEEHYGRDGCKSYDMLREADAPLFAQLFRNCSLTG